eukprot:5162287-Amphidinium_carterae.1
MGSRANEHLLLLILNLFVACLPCAVHKELDALQHEAEAASEEPGTRTLDEAPSDFAQQAGEEEPGAEELDQLTGVGEDGTVGGATEETEDDLHPAGEAYPWNRTQNG